MSRFFKERFHSPNAIVSVPNREVPGEPRLFSKFSQEANGKRVKGGDERHVSSTHKFLNSLSHLTSSFVCKCYGKQAMWRDACRREVRKSVSDGFRFPSARSGDDKQGAALM
jgi:hypothetical protein